MDQGTFYVKELDEVMPHRALNGRTPDEVYFAGGKGIPAGSPYFGLGN